MVPSPSTPTRDRILDYLSDHPTCNATGLAQDWGLTRADLRYHLAALLAEGLIEAAPRSPGQSLGRGRPVQSYRLAGQLRPNNLPALCHVLLTTLLAGIDAAQREETLRALGSSLAAELAPGFLPPPNLTRRLNQVVELLNHAHYRARWEAGAQGPRLLLRACPYAVIVANHPEMCRLDQAMLEQLLQVRLRHTTRLDPLTGKPPACIFTFI